MNTHLNALLGAVGVALLIGLAACGPGDPPASTAGTSVVPEDAPSHGEASPADQRHEAAGTVVNILAGKAYVVIDHGVIPGYMDAMTGMAFPVKDTSLLAGIQAGDSVSFVFTEADGILALQRRE